MKIERRLVAQPIELRAAEGQPPTIAGYGAVFGSETVIAGMFRERIEPGAFRQAVSEADIRATFDHELVLGRTTNGTLRLSEDARGLRYEIDPNPHDTLAMDVVARIQRGDVTGSSFGFRVAKNGDQWTPALRAGDLPLRVISEFEFVKDVGPVSFPAYDETTAEARSEAEAVLATAGVRAIPDDDPMTPEETALSSACQACADCCAAVVAASAPLVADEEHGAMARECVSACASMLQTCGRAMASLSGQDLYSYYSGSLATERARLDLMELETA